MAQAMEEYVRMQPKSKEPHEHSGKIIEVFLWSADLRACCVLLVAHASASILVHAVLLYLVIEPPLVIMQHGWLCNVSCIMLPCYAIAAVECIMALKGLSIGLALSASPL